ncbi:unnamed protein product [Schistosoma margrebowiei]|uniref:Uncharacterized protein n=1 Tax=Schistosoma margrebowiei TaxID=48269 RepID=A0A183N319_9TREM|nr:unnamed protein product [Schistosoma margrebowiei]
MSLLKTTATINIGTWNVRKLWETGITSKIFTDPQRYNLTVFGASEKQGTQAEHKMLDTGEIPLYSDHEEHNSLNTQGIALMLSSQYVIHL